jgi:uncharacterized protein (DUF58 family)
MLLSIRALLLMILPVLATLATSDPALSVRLFIIWNSVLLLMLLGDFFMIPAPSKFPISRDLPSRLFLGVANRIGLQISNNSRRFASLFISDEMPPYCEGESHTWKVDAKVGETQTITRLIKPMKRGKLLFGRVVVQLRGPLGLMSRQFTIAVNASASVYPDLSPVQSYTMCATTRQDTGMRPVRLWGNGNEFESLREYTRDDSYRLINWKATARKQKIIVENYEVERTQNIIIAIDTGRIMSTEAGKLTKIDHAANASLYLASMALKKDDRIGLVAFDARVNTFIPPGKGKMHFQRILEMLKDLQGSMHETDFEPLHFLMETKNRKRSLLVIFTDFMDTEISGDNIRHIARLHPHHMPLCVVISDPAIQAAALRKPDTMRVFYQKSVAGEILLQKEAALGLLKQAGIATLDVLPHKVTPAVIRAYLELKVRNKI